MENYFTDAMLYEDTLETSTGSTEDTRENYENGNEADTEPEPVNEEDFEFEINPLVVNSDIIDVTNTADEVGQWFINENLDFAYCMQEKLKSRSKIHTRQNNLAHMRLIDLCWANSSMRGKQPHARMTASCTWSYFNF